MKKIAIVCDSSVALTKQQIKELDVYVAPLAILHHGKEYSDQIDITSKDVQEILEKGELLSTSQPNLGIIVTILQEIKEKKYDHVFVLSLSSVLSGTLAAFKHGIEDVGLKNFSLIDSMTLCGPIQEACKAIRKLNKDNVEPVDIEAYLNDVFFKNTESFIYPASLEQLIRSGRISKSAALIASVLRVKPLLKLYNHGDTIEKFKTARTEQKILEEVIKDFKENNLNPEEHIIYLAHLQREDLLDGLKAKINEELGEFTYQICDLPAALATHAGLRSIAIQWALRADKSKISV